MSAGAPIGASPLRAPAPDDVDGGVTPGLVPPLREGDGRAVDEGLGATAAHVPDGSFAPAVQPRLPGKGTPARPAGTWLVVNASGPGLPG